MHRADNSTVRSARKLGRAERDIVAFGIAAAALILFVATGGTVFPQIVDSWMGVGRGPDKMLANALLLNIALIIFGWRRYRDLTVEVRERRKAEESARQLAETDVLTGLLNRRSFGKVTAEIAMQAHQSGRGVAILMIDLDDFKQVNDLHGHSAGDQVLVEAARKIEQLLPSDGVAARLGGDEFACVVPFSMDASERLDQLATSLLEAIAQPTNYLNKSIEVSVSIGIARMLDRDQMVEPEDYAQRLLHRADIAMYHAKKQGRNRYAWFEPTMESELRFRNELEAGIRKGIKLGEFVPYYEQQIDLDTGELMGFEMLARWNSPQFGLVSPDIFIPVAEDIGVIAELSENLIKQALQDAKHWDPKLTLSVNISPIQLRDPWFSQKLLRLLLESNFPPHRLEIEITESCLHENVGVVRTVVTSLKNQGVLISLDDFGTGYSSLAQLRSLPFDRLKIDRSFVAELADEGANSKIVEAIVSLGRGFDLPMTAEGIENTEVLEVLRKMGRLKGQGYLYGRPENASLTRERLAEKQLLANLRQELREEDRGGDPSPEQDPAASSVDRRAAG